MPFFEHDHLRFHYLDVGYGLPFLFQHGLGGDGQQPFELLPTPEGFRLLTLDCRAHGQTTPLGDPAKLSFSTFADDLAALMDRLSLRQAIVGGISMGAGIALNFALRFPERVLGLVLSRPAWLDRPLPANAQIFPLIATLIRNHGRRDGLARFQESADFKVMLAAWPDAATSLLGQFENPRAEETVEKLERIPNDVPSGNAEDWRRVAVPTLVLANREDPIHPFEFGEALAKAIPNATLREITSKSINKPLHLVEAHRHILQYLVQHFSSQRPGSAKLQN